MQPTDGDALCSRGQSLWSLIREHVSESQLPKIHAALGPSLVHRYTEAYTEMEMWQRLLEDTQRGVCSRTGAPLSGRHRSPLADPPAVKELVRAEVRMLLQTLRERAGRNEKELLSLYNPETVSYALGHAPRCHSRLSEDDDPRSTSRLSMQSCAGVEIEAVKDNLKNDDIEHVVDRLKSLFIEEFEALKQEIKQLRKNMWRKTQQDLEPTEPTLGDLRELRDAIQKDLAHYPVPYTSSVKELKSSHRLASATSHQPRVSSASSISNDHPQSNHVPFPQPKPPNGLPPVRTSSSPKLLGLSSPSKSKFGSFSTPEIREAALSQRINLHSTSPSGPSCSLIRQHDGDPSPEDHSQLCTTPTSTFSFSIKPQKNSATHKPHMTSLCSRNKAEESHLSPRMERRQSVGHGSRNTNIVSSHECNKDCKSNDCLGERPKISNGLQNTTYGNSLLAKHDGTGKRTVMPSNKCEMGSAKGHSKEMDTSGSHKEVAGVLYTKPKAHFSSSSPKKVSVSQTPREKPERNETEYLNRFVQPVPPSRVNTFDLPNSASTFQISPGLKRDVTRSKEILQNTAKLD